MSARRSMCHGIHYHVGVRSGDAAVSTGVPVFDHLLTAFARHSLTDLTVRAEGDIDIDVQLGAETDPVRITIANTIPAGPVHVAGHHVGLASARERILAMAGGNASVEVGVEGNRHVVAIQLQARRAGG